MKHNISQICKKHSITINDVDNLAEDLIDLDDKDFNTVLNYITDIRDEKRIKKKPTKDKNNKPESCPKCESNKIISYGSQGGKKKYFCKSCKHYFLQDKHLPSLGRCRKNSRIERECVKEILRHQTLKNIASDFDISVPTAFGWRHKILNSLKEYYEKQEKFQGRVELDEIYFPFSTSGNKNDYKNLKDKKGTDCIPEYLKYRVDKRLHRRGGALKKAGLSNNLICVATATNVPVTTTLAKCSNFGKPSTKEITNVFDGKFDDAVVLITDYEKSTHKYAVDNNIDVIQTRKGDKKENINTINNFHSRLRQSYKHYRSINSKYLENYMALEIFLHQNIKLSESEKIDKLLAIMNEVKIPLEYKDLKKTRYPSFVYESQDNKQKENEPNVIIERWDIDPKIKVNAKTSSQKDVAELEDSDFFNNNLPF